MGWVRPKLPQATIHRPPLFPWSRDPSAIPAVDFWFRESKRVWDNAHPHLHLQWSWLPLFLVILPSLLRISAPSSIPIVTLPCHHSLTYSHGLHLPAAAEVCAFQDSAVTISQHPCKDKRLVNSFNLLVQSAYCHIYSPVCLCFSAADASAVKRHLC